MTRCFLINEVWGRAYGELFLNHVLPNHLAPGNIPALARRVPCEYRIYTTAEDAAWMESHPAIKRLRGFIPATFISLDPTAAVLQADPEKKYAHYARYLRQAVVDALAAGAAILNLCPDAFFSDGSFARVAERSAQGKRLICLPGIRVLRDDFLADAAGPSSHDSPALVAQALRHLHPLTRSLFWNAYPFHDVWPSQLLWRLPGDDGLIVRTLHLHALFIDPTDKTYVPEHTLDDDYIQHACPDSRLVHFVQDSDEMFCVELSPANHFAGHCKKKRPASAWRVGAWAARHCRPRHFEAFRHAVSIHSQPLTPRDRQAAAQSDRVCRRIAASAFLHRLFWPRKNRHPSPTTP